MNEDPPYTFREDRAAQLRPVLQGVLASLVKGGAKG